LIASAAAPVAGNRPISSPHGKLRSSDSLCFLDSRTRIRVGSTKHQALFRFLLRDRGIPIFLREETSTAIASPFESLASKKRLSGEKVMENAKSRRPIHPFIAAA